MPLDNIAKRAEAYKPKERVTYKKIKEYIEAKYGFKVHTAYIAEVKVPCSTKKRMNWSTPRSTNVPVAVRVTVPGIIRGIFRRLPGKWNLMFPS